MTATCPDPRGPLVDRADFLEGKLEAFRTVREQCCKPIYTACFDVSSALAGETDAVGTQAALEGLMSACGELLDLVDDEIMHARWKLSAARRRGAP